MMRNELGGIGGILARRAWLNPDTEAYVDGLSGFRIGFAELNQRANRTAAALSRAGVGKGDRVALLLMNGVEFVESFFAVGKIGAVAVPLNWRLTADELEFILQDSGACVLLFGSEFAPTAADLHDRGGRTDVGTWWQVVSPLGGEVANPQAPEAFASSYEEMQGAGDAGEPGIRVTDSDLMYIMYTSGTTGLPKGVVHTHGGVLWALLTVVATAQNANTDRMLGALPMFHVGALTPLTMCFYMGIPSVVMRQFDPVAAWQTIEREKVTTGLLVPAMLNFMLQVGDLSRFDFSAVRWFMSGASPLPVNLIRQYLDLGIEIHQVYGLTESCGPACLITGEDARRKLGSTGKAFFHTDVRVVDAAGKDCLPGAPGEILVAGKHVMKEYWNNPAATAETIVAGWLHTGDVATVDAEGFVYVQDRIKDMIISGGENIYPAEVENVLMAHPDIVEVAVIGQPSERWGESPFAVVVSRRADLSETEVLQFGEDKLASFKTPKGVAFLDTLPRNPSGKVLKRVLRERFPGPAPV